jgi:seryl-tRNA synthetase
LFAGLFRPAFENLMMLDIRRISENPEAIEKALRSKGAEVPVADLLALHEKRRQVITEVEAKKNERNIVSRELGQRKQAGEDISEQQHAMRELAEHIRGLDQEVRELEETLNERLLAVPNLPHASVPVGEDASANREVRTWGTPRAFAFKPKPHWEVGKRLGMFDFERAARLSGSGFPLMLGAGARLQRALIQFMLDLHTREHGYLEVAPPYLANAAAMTGTGQLPKLQEDMYQLPADNLYLIPTAEVPVTNLYREEILDRPLPIRHVAHTPCFRREAGAAGKETRGLIRVHQFEKVELVKFVEPDRSYEELESLVADAEVVLQRLDLPYRVLELCTGDLSFAAAKCYDIELWAPGHDGWLEVSSCSNFEDFQARRAGIRYRAANGKPAFVHTLNGSGVALPRLIVAILENYQEADGTVVVPEVLRPWLQGQERIEPQP